MATPFGGPMMVSPRHLASPEDGAISPAMMRNSVDLPEPDRQIDVFQHQQILAAALRKRPADAADVEKIGLIDLIEHESPLGLAKPWINQGAGGVLRRHRAAARADG